MINTKAALDQLGIHWKQEECTWYDGDCWVLSDLWCEGIRTTIELDGGHHKREQFRDQEKADIILRTRGYRTVRVWNWEAMRPGLVNLLVLRLGLDGS